MPPVSLRLGHVRVLTVSQTVIHCAHAASLPIGRGFLLVCLKINAKCFRKPVGETFRLPFIVKLYFAASTFNEDLFAKASAKGKPSAVDEKDRAVSVIFKDTEDRAANEAAVGKESVAAIDDDRALTFAKTRRGNL